VHAYAFSCSARERFNSHGDRERSTPVTNRRDPNPPVGVDKTTPEAGKDTGVIMHGQCLVAVYPSRSEAEQAFRAARGSGIASHNMRMSGSDTGQAHAWDWLFSLSVPERDKTYYRTHLAEGRTALSVLLDGGASPAKINAVEEMLDRFHPVDLRVEEDQKGSSEEDHKGSSAAAAGQTEKAAGPSARAGAEAAEAEEEIIPLPREKPKVGTRATDRVRRIRTYVVEEPFEKEVSLSDERLVVKRRPATTSEGSEITEREYEFHERHDEPVVEKTREDEELAIRKEASQHTQRVRGTVRKTRVEVQKQPGVQLSPKDRGGR
jgi:hypothetical protein